MNYNVKLFNDNFSDSVKATLVENLRIATSAVDSFWISNLNFLDEGEIDLYSRLLNYAVQKQLRHMVSGNSGIIGLTERKLNDYGAKAVCIETSDYILNVCRTQKPMSLPPKAKYKTAFAAGNREDQQQLEFKFSDNGDLIPALPKRYAILGYRFYRGNMLHSQLLVPDYRFTDILFSEDLLPLFKSTPSHIFTIDAEEQITNLKQDLLVRLKKAK